METKKHRWQMDLSCGSLEEFWADRTDVYVAGNMALYYSLLQIKRDDFRAPDVMIFLGTEARPEKSWVMWEQDGKGPDVIIELTSESTAAVDRGEKKRIYASLIKVPEYFIYDPISGELEGYRLNAGQLAYEPIAFNQAGRLGSERLGLELGIWQGRFRALTGCWLRWYQADGTLVPTPREMADEAEEQRRELEARLRAYEEKFGPLPE